MGRIFLNEENLHLHSLCKEFRESQAGSTTEIKYEAQCGWREGSKVREVDKSKGWVLGWLSTGEPCDLVCPLAAA